MVMRDGIPLNFDVDSSGDGRSKESNAVAR